MDNLKRIIEENRAALESEDLIHGHKERFLERYANINRRGEKNREIKFYLLAAAVITFIIISPLKVLKQDRESIRYYQSLLEVRGAVVYEMAGKLDSYNRDMVLNTLDELTREAIPFDSQLPDELTNRKRRELTGLYYKPKIEGIERLKGYVGELLSIN